jgi:hypothetical protein
MTPNDKSFSATSMSQYGNSQAQKWMSLSVAVRTNSSLIHIWHNFEETGSTQDVQNQAEINWNPIWWCRKLTWTKIILSYRAEIAASQGLQNREWINKTFD